MDLEAVLTRPREDLHIFPEERSSVFGDLTIEYTVPGYEGRRSNLSDHPDGYLIGPSLSSAELVEHMCDTMTKGGSFFTLYRPQSVSLTTFKTTSLPSS